MGGNGDRLLRFGDYELDSDSGKLSHDGQPVKIQPQPLRVLGVLAERAGEIVSREQLRERIWGEATFVEFDQGLNYCIRQIRVALGDNAAKPVYVETLPRQGYRFLATVVHANGNGTGVETAPAIQPPVSILQGVTKRSRWILTATVCAMAAIAVSWVSVPRKPHIVSLAVLPLNNFSGGSGQDYYADGMTDELTTMLVKNSTLHVASQTSAMQYKNAHRPLPEIAKNLGVDAILEGSVARSGNRVHVTVQLIDARRDANIWAESFDRDWNDSAALSWEVAQSVARQLHSPAAPAVAERYVQPEAHDAYLHGRYLWFTGHNSEAGEYFRKAAELQPDYALAWTGVADYYAAAAVDGLANPKESLRQAEAPARKAVSLDDSLAQAHNTLCAINFFANWNWAQALEECNRAIELDPSFAEAYHLRAKVLGALNRHGEAIQSERRAMELNPFARPWGLVFVLNNARQYDAAITEAKARLESDPTDVILLRLLEIAYRCKGMDKEAAETAEKALRVSGDTDAADARSRAFERGGNRAVIQASLTDATRQSRSRYVSPIFLAGLTAQLDERQETLTLLERGYEEHSPALLEVQFDPAYDFLHGEERYRSIIRKVGLPPAF